MMKKLTALLLAMVLTVSSLTSIAAAETDGITMTVVKGNDEEYTYELGNEAEYTLPSTHREFVEKYPELVNKGHIFKGFYKKGLIVSLKKVKTISEDMTVVTKNRTLKTKLKKVKCVDGKVVLKFNKKDWENVDGFKISYSMNKKFKKNKTKTINVKTKGKTFSEYTIKKSKKKFKNGGGYYIKVEFYYNCGNEKVICVCRSSNKGTVAYKNE